MLLWERKYAVVDLTNIIVTLAIAIHHTICPQWSLKLKGSIDFTIDYLKSAFSHLFIHLSIALYTTVVILSLDKSKGKCEMLVHMHMLAET